jgi:two-component system, OmpR family, response regulator
MTEQPTILAIDDDHAFIGDLKTFFQRKGIGIATISDPILTPALDFQKFKIVLLDLDMPGLSGEEVLAQIPAGRRPIIIIVSGHSDLETRLRVLDQGADFFLPKPVDLTEVLLICRRALGREAPNMEMDQIWTLSRTNHTLCSPQGTIFGLTLSEFKILELLFEAKTNVVMKETLAYAVTAREGEAAVSFYRSLEVMISRMRTRFSEPDLPLPIKALRNVGYVFHGQGVIEE